MLINNNLGIYNAAWLHLHIEESLMQMASSDTSIDAVLNTDCRKHFLPQNNNFKTSWYTVSPCKQTVCPSVRISAFTWLHLLWRWWRWLDFWSKWGQVVGFKILLKKISFFKVLESYLHLYIYFDAHKPPCYYLTNYICAFSIGVSQH